jgi:hypothetical protein
MPRAGFEPTLGLDSPTAQAMCAVHLSFHTEIVDFFVTRGRHLKTSINYSFPSIKLHNYHHCPADKKEWKKTSYFTNSHV